MQSGCRGGYGACDLGIDRLISLNILEQCRSHGAFDVRRERDFTEFPQYGEEILWMMKP